MKGNLNMKRALLLLLVLLLAMPAVTFAAPRTTTVMIYMCGSDLESRHGAASADIAEMLASGFDTSAVNVILMLGGSTEWELGFDPEVLTIAEIGRRGLRTVQTMDAMDMGDPATLKLFVEIAREQCPADRYALILWDHGGGPSGGVCFDEVAASGNAITPREIHIALNAVSPKIRFDWIGFDACLMASLETAFYLVDNADYMIASEESEPGSGWDYAFLKGLPNDRNGADTGRRVVEYFAAGGENSRDVYTMSCIDLNRVERLANLFNTYFSDLADTLDADSYPVISNARHDGGSFGRTIYDDSLDYDLVDLGTFITACGGDNTALLDCLNEAVVCSGGNSEYATGLTVYHPYYNKAGNGRRYTDEVGVNLKGYQRYLKRFSGFLNGAPMTDWSNIETVYVGTDENGDAVFSATLTDEQV
ncbi:MAG: clostripain-related cysteine peptidase, partial [Clostridia bacterium]|nr:clostripain-related cysteine peptidase [Clostridia bacterium]